MVDNSIASVSTNIARSGCCMIQIPDRKSLLTNCTVWKRIERMLMSKVYSQLVATDDDLA